MSKTPDAPNDPLDEDRYIVPGLVRGLRVLGAFTPERKDMSLSELAKELGLSRSAAFRTTYTLTQMGFLLQDARTKSYTLGPAVLRLGYGYLATRELVEVALPELERLRDETDWSTHLGIRDGSRVLYLLRVPSRLGMGSIVHVGSRLPAASTTMGRVLLADLDEATIIALYRNSAEHKRSYPEVLQQWKRDQGAACIEQIGSFETGIASVAAPVRDISGKVIAAINATKATDGPSAIPAAITQAVDAAARRISVLLGARDR